MGIEQLNNPELIVKLQQILDANRDKRIIVVGTTCTGKSTFLQHIPGALDMDALVFPQLTPEEDAYVNQTPWTPEIGATMTRLTKERVRVDPGHPVFGTVLLDTDLIVDLDISDELLRQRTVLRGTNFEDAKNMQQQIKEEIQQSGIPCIGFKVG